MEIPRHWRLFKQRYGLIGEECPHCEIKIFPPRDVCPGCGQECGGKCITKKHPMYNSTREPAAPVLG